MIKISVPTDHHFLAFPVWTNNSDWSRYSLTITGSSEKTSYIMKLPAENGDLMSSPSYHAFLPVIPGEELVLECDAPYDINGNIFTTDSPDFGPKEEPEVIHYHAPYGSINDPNGMIFDNGLWHMYHQHNPLDSIWGNMSWGHSVSKDLIHFEFVGDVLFPDNNGVMFSGCAIKNERACFGLPSSALLYFYTLADDRITENGKKLQVFRQRLAYSIDNGYTLIKYPDWEIENIEADNRDPKVFWHEESSSYIMTLYLTKNRFCILRSTDLENWSKTCELDLPPMWECPDLFPLSKDIWAFMSADGFYYMGSFDGYEFKLMGEMQKLYDNGLPYAAQSFSNTGGRLISTAWLRTENRGENWHGMMGVARELMLGGSPSSPYIKQSFVKEAKQYIKISDGMQIIEDKYIRETISGDGRLLTAEQLW